MFPQKPYNCNIFFFIYIYILACVLNPIWITNTKKMSILWSPQLLGKITRHFLRYTTIEITLKSAQVLGKKSKNPAFQCHEFAMSARLHHTTIRIDQDHIATYVPRRFKRWPYKDSLAGRIHFQRSIFIANKKIKEWKSGNPSWDNLCQLNWISDASSTFWTSWISVF